MSAKMTRGPWMFSRINGTSPRYSITARAGALLADVYLEKNAAPIAAVPDLIEALQRLLSYAKLVIHSTDEVADRDALNFAIAALKKAGVEP